MANLYLQASHVFRKRREMKNGNFGESCQQEAAVGASKLRSLSYEQPCGRVFFFPILIFKGTSISLCYLASVVKFIICNAYHASRSCSIIFSQRCYVGIVKRFRKCLRTLNGEGTRVARNRCAGTCDKTATENTPAASWGPIMG